MSQLLEVKNMSVDFTTDQGVVHAVRDVSFNVGEREILGIVGESGSGKSQTMYSVMGLLARNGHMCEGEILFNGHDLTRSHYANRQDYRKMMWDLRGKEIAMIFQDPMTFLNPVLTIGKQLTEPLLNHTKMTKKEAEARAIELMRQVGIPSPEKRLKQYPHEFSGGMRQRIIIAIALACEPKHPYTRGLLSCVHNPEKDEEELRPIPGSPPDLLAPPAGCPFVDRCEKAMKICKQQMPEVTQYSETHSCACWLEEARKRGLAE